MKIVILMVCFKKQSQVEIQEEKKKEIHHTIH